MDEDLRVDESLFEIGDPDSDGDDDLRLTVEGEEEQDDNKQMKGDNKQVKVGNNTSETKTESKMKDPTYNQYKGQTVATVRAPKYEAIRSSDSDDEEEGEKPRNRNMLGYAAHHGSRFIPAEIKDNWEHFIANTPTAAPSLHVAPPPNVFGNFY